MKNKILVTGSSGMIGTALCEEFLKRGIEFVGVDKRKNEWNKKVDDCTIHMDLLDKLKVRLFKNKIEKGNFTMIIHLAANARVWDLVVDTSKAVENVEMTNTVYEIAKAGKIKKVIVASSREVYGEALQKSLRKLKEQDALISNCSNQYAASKIFLEAIANAYKVVENIDSVILRFSNVYGKYDTSDRFVPLMIQRMIDNKEVQIFGGKKKSMDFTFLSNTVDGIFTTIKNFDKMKISDRNDGTYNVSSGKSSTLYDTAKILKNGLNSYSEIKLCKNRPGEPMYYVADISKIKKFGFNPDVSLQQGLVHAIDYYKKLYES